MEAREPKAQSDGSLTSCSTTLVPQVVLDSTLNNKIKIHNANRQMNQPTVHCSRLGVWGWLQDFLLTNYFWTFLWTNSSLQVTTANGTPKSETALEGQDRRTGLVSEDQVKRHADLGWLEAAPLSGASGGGGGLLGQTLGKGGLSRTQKGRLPGNARLGFQGLSV